MTHKEFIDEVRNEYIKARKCIYLPKKNSEILRRGTSRTISAIAEDIFAAYCAEKASNLNGLEIIADPQISFSGTGLRNVNDKKSLLIRPDIAICRNKKIECLFDLKMDLGYKRGLFLNDVKDRNEQLNLIKGYDAKINGNPYVISNQIELIYILLSEKNSAKGSHVINMESVKQFENINAFLLSNGAHLNAYHDNPIFKINENEFTELDTLLEKYLS